MYPLSYAWSFFVSWKWNNSQIFSKCWNPFVALSIYYLMLSSNSKKYHPPEKTSGHNISNRICFIAIWKLLMSMARNRPLATLRGQQTLSSMVYKESSERCLASQLRSVTWRVADSSVDYSEDLTWTWKQVIEIRFSILHTTLINAVRLVHHFLADHSFQPRSGLNSHT